MTSCAVDDCLKKPVIIRRSLGRRWALCTLHQTRFGPRWWCDRCKRVHPIPARDYCAQWADDVTVNYVPEPPGDRGDEQPADPDAPSRCALCGAEMDGAMSLYTYASDRVHSGCAR